VTGVSLAATPTPPTHGSYDLVMQADIAWSLGFMRPSADFPFGTGPRSLGMPGLGGSFGYADLRDLTELRSSSYSLVLYQASCITTRAEEPNYASHFALRNYASPFLTSESIF
jgi:hypothetical protein